MFIRVIRGNHLRSMKLLPFIMVLIASVSTLLAQSANPNLQAMVDAEKAFIEMAKTQNRRDAFLYFLTDSAVTQGPNGPTKGKARIEQQKVTNDWLFWEVGYSDIAASGDFGFNTGPWEFRANKTDEKPVAWGEFNSIWKKQPDGSWKNALDIGISHDAPTEPVRWSTSKKPLGASKVKAKKMGAAFAAEIEFQKNLANNRKTAYQKSISPEARMMVAGHLPFVGSPKLNDFLKACPPQSNVKVLGTETASSGDLGFVYGTVDVSLTKDGKPENKKATFVRVWKFESGKWKIVLDVLTF